MAAPAMSAQAFEALLELQRGLTLHQGGLLRAALAGATDFVEMRRYPANDVVDRCNGTRFFFHAHPDAFRQRGEYGHFHVFRDPAGQGAGTVSHLIGIALDAQGLPVRLFTTNRWVTGERWQDHRRMLARLDGFRCVTRGRLAPVARWVTACVHAHAGEIRRLLEQRDRRIARLAGARRRAEVFEDRSIEVLTEQSVTLLPPVRGGSTHEERTQ